MHAKNQKVKINKVTRSHAMKAMNYLGTQTLLRNAAVTTKDLFLLSPPITSFHFVSTFTTYHISQPRNCVVFSRICKSKSGQWEWSTMWLCGSFWANCFPTELGVLFLNANSQLMISYKTRLALYLACGNVTVIQRFGEQTRQHMKIWDIILGD